MEALCDEGERERRAAHLECRAILEEKAVNERTPWQQGRRVASAMAQLRRQVEATQEVELARALGQLGHLDERDRAVVRQFGQRMVDQMQQQLLSRVRQLIEQEPTEAALELLLHVFAGDAALPDQADREAPVEATPTPRHATRRATRSKPR